MCINVLSEGGFVGLGWDNDVTCETVCKNIFFGMGTLMLQGRQVVRKYFLGWGGGIWGCVTGNRLSENIFWEVGWGVGVG